MSGRVVFQHHGMAVLLQWWLNDDNDGKNVMTADTFLHNEDTAKVETHPSKQQRSFGCHIEIKPKCPRHHPVRREREKRSYCRFNNSSLMKKGFFKKWITKISEKTFPFLIARFAYGPEPIEICAHMIGWYFSQSHSSESTGFVPQSWSFVFDWCQNYNQDFSEKVFRAVCVKNATGLLSITILTYCL